MVIFIQEIDLAIQNSNTVNILVLRVRGINESVPSPVHSREEDAVLKEGVPEVENGVLWADV